jgi:cytidylate kinase
MSVITISRGSFSGGKMLAENLAEELHYRCIDRDVVVERAIASGTISQAELQRALDSPPKFLERLKHKRYIYLAVIQAALAEEVRDGRVVYHGHAGHLLLKGGGPVFRVRITAPMEVRISMAQQRLALGRQEVIAYIHKVDEERKKWTHYLYGVDWTDATLYDMVLNLEYVDLEAACDMVASAVRRQKCFQFDDRCKEAMENLARASRVKANLALNPATSGLELEVIADAGEVRIRGKIFSVDEIEEIERVSLQTEGVERVNVEELAPATPA